MKIGKILDYYTSQKKNKMKWKEDTKLESVKFSFSCLQDM